MKEGVNYNYLDSFIDVEESLIENKEIDSYAYIKNGCLKVHHPPEGPYPIVIPCPGVKLVINGRQYTEPMPIFMEDEVSIHTEDELIEGHWSLSVSEDGLEAILHIEPTVIIHRKLLDLPPARILELEVEESREYRCPITLEELLRELTAKKISYGIDWQNCTKALKTCKTDKIVIARGMPAKKGKDGRVELLFKPDLKTAIVSDEDETVDFRKRYIFTSIEAGEVLAVKHPPEIGSSGRSVTGQIIEPPTQRDAVLSAGEGAILTEDGKRVVATRSGRPTVSRNGNKVKVGVVNELVHTGDVDLSSGNISFRGDILILGNVTENMSVESSQNIRISGLVSGARINAYGSIFINGNIISSSIYAGKAPEYQEKVLPSLHTLYRGLKDLIINTRQLLRLKGLKEELIGPIVKYLLEEKFGYLLDAAKELCERTETTFHEMPFEGMQEFIYRVKKDLINFSLAIYDLAKFEKLEEQARTLVQNLAFYPATDSNIVASSIQNSVVFATGDIDVVGSGCYISKIQAGRKVNIKAVVRGGEVIAGSDVFIGELGSIGGFPTRVVAEHDAVVKIGYAHVNSVVVIGGQSYRFSRDEENAKFWLDGDGNLRSSNY